MRFTSGCVVSLFVLGITLQLVAGQEADKSSYVASAASKFGNFSWNSSMHDRGSAERRSGQRKRDAPVKSAERLCRAVALAHPERAADDGFRPCQGGNEGW
jgi:hypothetical protein